LDVADISKPPGSTVSENPVILLGKTETLFPEASSSVVTPLGAQGAKSLSPFAKLAYCAPFIPLFISEPRLTA
ncbi:MAG: hypothetical protein HRT73_00220, partial [Flavobacteriales bacterium]|nr:hypothetical protein [Flavobacteriales bacterium]